jgi:hypothetical protein
VKKNQFNIDHGVSIWVNIIFVFIYSFYYLAWTAGFLTNDTLLILHAGCLTFHAVNHHKQTNNGTKIRNIITNTEKV